MSCDGGSWFEQGKFKLMAGVISDISELKEMEMTLRISEEKYRVLIENVNDVIFVLDKDGNIRYITPSVSQFGGRRPEWFTGVSIFVLVHPDDVEIVTRFFSETSYSNGGILEFRIQGMFGIRWVRLSARQTTRTII